MRKEIEDMTRRMETIDGDKAYVLDKSMKNGLDVLRRKKDDVVYTYLKRCMEFICSHEDFAMAFIPTHSRIVRWIPCMIYKYKGEWRRVVLQNANCLRCEWRGSAANPTHPELYVSMENWSDILKKMKQLPFLKCPRCGSEISTKAIWIEDE